MNVELNEKEERIKIEGIKEEVEKDKDDIEKMEEDMI